MPLRVPVGVTRHRVGHTQVRVVGRSFPRWSRPYRTSLGRVSDGSGPPFFVPAACGTVRRRFGSDSRAVPTVRCRSVFAPWFAPILPSIAGIRVRFVPQRIRRHGPVGSTAHTQLKDGHHRGFLDVESLALLQVCRPPLRVRRGSRCSRTQPADSARSRANWSNTTFVPPRTTGPMNRPTTPNTTMPPKIPTVMTATLSAPLRLMIAGLR